MNVLYLIIFILIFILLLIIIPIKIRVCLHINYLNMEAYYLIYFGVLNIICGKLGFGESGLVIKNKINLLKNNSKNHKYSDFLIEEYLNKIKVSNVNFYKTYGADYNAMNTALIASFENIIFDSINLYLKTKNATMNCYNYINPNFTFEENKTSVYAVIKISVLDVIISIIKAKLRIVKLKKTGEK